MRNANDDNLRWVKLKEFRIDSAAAFDRLKESAESGDTDAYSHLGYAYELGEGPGEPDYKEAFKWYEKSYKEVDDVWAAVGLGRLFYYGNGVERDYGKALKYFEDAENNNIDYVYLMLGQMFHLGRGAERDLMKAKKYYMRAIDLGNIWGIRFLGQAESEMGNYWKGLVLIIKAIFKGFFIALKDIDDRRIAR